MQCSTTPPKHFQEGRGGKEGKEGKRSKIVRFTKINALNRVALMGIKYSFKRRLSGVRANAREVRAARRLSNAPHAVRDGRIHSAEFAGTPPVSH